MNPTIRPITRACYDLQKLRISVGNRVAASFRAKLDIAPAEKKEDADAEAAKILEYIAGEYDLLCSGYAELGKTITSRNFARCGIFENFADYELVRNYHELLANERAFFHTLKRYVEDTRLWSDFLAGVPGVGPAMAGVILSEIDIHKARYPSSLWKLAGLDVATDGRGRSRRAEHLVRREYQDKNGETKERDSITFNPFLKTKMVGVLGASFIKQPASKCKYRRAYDDYKHRLEHAPAHAEKSKGHRHNMAVRYMVKMFLADLWLAWRSLEGLPITEPYHVAKLGLRDHAAAA